VTKDHDEFSSSASFPQFCSLQYCTSAILFPYSLSFNNLTRPAQLDWACSHTLQS